MRLWSLHPKNLDKAGLGAVWREALLAKAVLEGKTKGYKNHPQLKRFKMASNPLAAINVYLLEILMEASTRGYSYDPSKISFQHRGTEKIPVNLQQVLYEAKHLQKKIETRSPDREDLIKALADPDVHPLFQIVLGPIEDWEKTKKEDNP